MHKKPAKNFQEKLQLTISENIFKNKIYLALKSM
jgi:hypothetical protein